MSGNELFIDSNILYFLFKNDVKILDLIANKNLHISFITKIEILSNPNLTKETRATMRKMLNGCKIHTINDEVIENSIQIRTNYKLKIPDSIIAATAKTLNFPLLTADVEFQKLEKITAINIYSKSNN